MRILELESEMLPKDRVKFHEAIVRARLDSPVTLSVRAKATVVAPYEWVLQRVAGGLKLTTAGYMPTTVVDSALEDLGWSHEWPGTGNREIDTVPVRALRVRMHELGLLRRWQGIDWPTTPLGEKLTGNPAELWDFLVRAILAQDSEQKRLAMQFLLLLTASASCSTEEEYIHGVASGMWAVSTQQGKPLLCEPKYTFGLISEAYALLHSLGVFSITQDGEEWGGPTITGTALARYALMIPESQLPPLPPDPPAPRWTSTRYQEPEPYPFRTT